MTSRYSYSARLTFLAPASTNRPIQAPPINRMKGGHGARALDGLGCELTPESTGKSNVAEVEVSPMPEVDGNNVLNRPVHYSLLGTILIRCAAAHARNFSRIWRNNEGGNGPYSKRSGSPRDTGRKSGPGQTNRLTSLTTTQDRASSRPSRRFTCKREFNRLPPLDRRPVRDRQYGDDRLP